MIKAGVKAQFLHHEVAFLGAARDANNLAAADLGNLPGNLPNGARGCADHHRFPRLGLADIGKPGPGRQPRHAEHAKA